MGQALYRRYRSRSLDEVVGQEHITTTLQNALKSGRISHAYLFTGPRGVGKTSVARILAHEVNNLPYKDESIHLDIIEIDAASNRRIDEIRDLRDKVHIAPTSAKYKVYIIDEVHMLTREAFNALLKTLEEPPAHCIFILATTEAHKLPETIISRTQRFNFKPIENKAASKHLSELAKKEKIDITADALEILASHGGGSFRDSISLLDQLSSSGQKVTAEMIRTTLGLPEETAINSLIDAVRTGRSQEVVNNLELLLEQSANPALIASNLSQVIRKQLIDGQKEAWVPELLKALLDVPASSQPYEYLEISLLEAAAQNNNTQSTPVDKYKKDTHPSPHDSSGNEESEPEKQPKQIKTSSAFDLDKWPEVIEHVKKQVASLYTALKLASPKYEEGILILAFKFPLHQKKVNQSKHKDIIAQTIEELTGSKLKIECVVDKNAFEKNEKTTIVTKPTEPTENNNFTHQLQSISNIFGTAEVLES